MLIKIDRSTITTNPSHGETSSVVATGTEISFEYKGRKKLEYLKHLKSGLITSWEESPGPDGSIVYFYQGVIIDTQNTDLLEKLSRDGVTLKISRRLQLVAHAPGAQYLYKYEKTEITCDCCGAKFDHSELLSDYESDDVFCENICPSCGKWYCCDEIKYERIGDVIKELTK